MLYATAWMLYDGFGKYYQGSSIDGYLEKLKNQLENDNPHIFTYVAKHNQEYVGTAGTYLKWGGEKASHLSPWLGGLYVKESSRRLGIAFKLASEVINKFGELGYSNCYLHTPNQENLYRKWGWETVMAINHNNSDEKIMKYQITSNKW